MFRIFHEMRAQVVPGYFLTLTYDEKYVKRVADGRLSLRFRDVQLFLKQLRKKKFYAKYICVGEYGAVTKRPHYHQLLWTDCPPEDIQKIWHRGQIHFGRITIQSAMYTLKYIIQPKQRSQDGIEPTRAQFSKGIGIGFLSTSMYDFLTRDYDDPVMFSVIDGRKVAIPRYFKNKIFTKFQMRKQQSKSKWDCIRKRRKQMRALLAQGVTNTKDYMQALRVEQGLRILKSTKFNQSL